MRRALVLGLVLAAGCTPTRTVSVTFGTDGEGLDGFLCKDASGKFLLERLQEADGGTATASLVVDFIHLGGVPGCRTGQLIKWCESHDCSPLRTTRSCVTVPLPSRTDGLTRDALRTAVLNAMKQADAAEVIADAPDEFVLARVVGTTQPCADIAPVAPAELPAFESADLLGCAYSCPVLFDKVEQDVYLGFETVTGCEQGVRICADGQLHWQP